MNTSYLKLVNAFCTAFCLVMGSGQQCQYSHAIQVVDKHVDGKSNQQLCHFENLQGGNLQGHQHIYGKTITMVVKQKETVMTRHELGEKYM